MPLCTQSNHVNYGSNHRRERFLYHIPAAWKDILYIQNTLCLKKILALLAPVQRIYEVDRHVTGFKSL